MSIITQLNEVAFSNSRFDKAIYLIQKLLTKRTSKTMYRYGGAKGYDEFVKSKSGPGTGVLFLIKGGAAVRFNWEKKRSKSVAITSIDYWNEYVSDKRADKTMETTNFNTVVLVNLIAQLIKQPSAKKLKLEENTVGGEWDSLNEGKWKRTSLANFHTLAMNMFGKSDLTQKELYTIRDDTGFSPPSIIFDNHIEGTKPKVFRIPESDNVQISKGEREESVGEEKAIQNGVARADGVTVDELFEELEGMATMFRDGFVRSLLVTGGGGTGKTYTIVQILNQGGYKEGEGYKKLSGKISPMGLYTELFISREEEDMLVFDDIDSVFGSEESRNILKAALDTTGDRTITWKSPLTVDLSGLEGDEYEEELALIGDKIKTGQEVKLPNRFDFKGRVLFISNLPENKIEQAIISRSMHIDVTLSSQEVFDRMEVIMQHIEPANGQKVSIEQKQELLDELRATAKRHPNKYYSMRNFVKGLNIISSGTPDWKRYIKRT